jgi:hypothetical protein
MSLPEILLVLVFRAARSGRRPHLTALCRRTRCKVTDLEKSFELLEQRGLLWFDARGERLTLAGLALGAALSKASRQRLRPPVSCRSLAA